MTDRETGRSRASVSSRWTTTRKPSGHRWLNGSPFKGRPLTVNEARPREEGGGGGGGGGYGVGRWTRRRAAAAVVRRPTAAVAVVWDVAAGAAWRRYGGGRIPRRQLIVSIPLRRGEVRHAASGNFPRVPFSALATTASVNSM